MSKPAQDGFEKLAALKAEWQLTNACFEPLWGVTVSRTDRQGNPVAYIPPCMDPLTGISVPGHYIPYRIAALAVTGRSGVSG